MLMWMILAALPAAAQDTESFEATATTYGRQADCTRAVYFSTSAEHPFVVEKPSLVAARDLRAEIVGTAECVITVDRVSLTLSGVNLVTERVSLGAERGGTFAEKLTYDELEPRVLKAGEHTIGLSVQGTASLRSDTLEQALGGTLVIWRDLDGDGDPDARLPDGNDCDDTDPDRNSSAPDYDDDIDNDCDGIVDNDDDEDGLNDALERDYGADPTQADTDGDGVSDGVEWGEEEVPRDTDGDGLFDFEDEDSDGDGIEDRAETGPGGELMDTDGDGIPDLRDTDDDGDGLPTSEESTEDSDGDGLPDYLDPDSDNDGALDGAEGTSDLDGDGIPNHLDPGGDYGQESEPEGVEARGFGLGCSTGSAPATGALMLLGLLLLGRRRR